MLLNNSRSSILALKLELDQVVLELNVEKLEVFQNTLVHFDSLEEDINYIRYEIYSLLSYLSGFAISDINEDQNIKYDLGINNYEKLFFRRKFNEIIISHLIPEKFTIVPKKPE